MSSRGDDGDGDVDGNDGVDAVGDEVVDAEAAEPWTVVAAESWTSWLSSRERQGYRLVEDVGSGSMMVAVVLDERSR